MIHAILLTRTLVLPSTNQGQPFMPIQVCRDEVTPFGSGYGLNIRAEVANNLNTVIAVQRVTRKDSKKIIAYIIQLANRNEYIQNEPAMFVSRANRNRLLRVAEKSKLLMHTTIPNFKIALNSKGALFNRIYPLKSIRPFLAQGLTIRACTPHSIGVPPPV